MLFEILEDQIYHGRYIWASLHIRQLKLVLVHSNWQPQSVRITSTSLLVTSSQP
jgi:hypothetical protein